MKNFAITAILIVIFGAGYYFYQKQPSTPDQTSPLQTNVSNPTSPTVPASDSAAPEVQTENPKVPSSETLITYNETGFEPASLTLKPGAKVAFRNRSGAPFWPASDPHPVHAAHPDFDPRKPIPSGADYSFTFSVSGRYPYHDHLQPQKKGIVIVE